jgi:hypothetical protein
MFVLSAVRVIKVRMSLGAFFPLRMFAVRSLLLVGILSLAQ